MEFQDIMLLLIFLLLVILVLIWLGVAFVFMKWHWKKIEERKKKFQNQAQEEANQISSDNDIIIASDFSPNEAKNFQLYAEVKKKPGQKKSNLSQSSNSTSIFKPTVNENQLLSEKRKSDQVINSTKTSLTNSIKSNYVFQQGDISFGTPKEQKTTNDLQGKKKTTGLNNYFIPKSHSLSKPLDDSIIDLTSNGKKTTKTGWDKKTVASSDLLNKPTYEKNEKYLRNEKSSGRPNRYRNKDSEMVVRNSIYAGDLHSVTNYNSDEGDTPPAGIFPDLYKNSFLESKRRDIAILSQTGKSAPKNNNPPPVPSAVARTPLEKLKFQQENQVQTGYVEMKPNLDGSLPDDEQIKSGATQPCKKTRFQSTNKKSLQSLQTKKLNRRSMSFSGISLKQETAYCTVNEMKEIKNSVKPDKKSFSSNSKPLFDDETNEYVDMFRRN